MKLSSAHPEGRYLGCFVDVVDRAEAAAANRMNYMLSKKGLFPGRLLSLGYPLARPCSVLLLLRRKHSDRFGLHLDEPRALFLEFDEIEIPRVPCLSAELSRHSTRKGAARTESIFQLLIISLSGRF